MSLFSKYVILMMMMMMMMSVSPFEWGGSDIGANVGTGRGANPRFAGVPPPEMHHNVPVFKLRDICDDDDEYKPVLSSGG
jgi:hypothetical protein